MSLSYYPTIWVSYWCSCSLSPKRIIGVHFLSFLSIILAILWLSLCFLSLLLLHLLFKVFKILLLHYFFSQKMLFLICFKKISLFRVSRALSGVIASVVTLHLLDVEALVRFASAGRGHQQLLVVLFRTIEEFVNGLTRLSTVQVKVKVGVLVSLLLGIDIRFLGTRLERVLTFETAFVGTLGSGLSALFHAPAHVVSELFLHVSVSSVSFWLA